MIEIIVILAVLGVMAAVLAPVVLNYLDDSRKSKAESDVKTLGGSILRLTRDVGHFPLYKDGAKTTGGSEIDLLVGPGNDPVDGTGKWLSSGGSGTFPGQGEGVQGGFPGQGKGVQRGFPGQGPGVSAVTDNLENHLTRNAPGGSTSNPYPVTGPLAWRGPYLEKITEDSWGNRYLVNIRNAHPDQAKAVWVLSAGPNGIIETDPDAATDAGPTPGGDDIAIRLR